MSEPAHDVLKFWRAAGEKSWWRSDPSFDAKIRDQFHKLHQDAANGKLVHWLGKAETALALVIVLDQFSRNIYRGEARAFACDLKAQQVAQQNLKRGYDLKFDEPDRLWFYMPLMHSENPELQSLALKCFSERLAKNEKHLKFAQDHKQVIDRFGRFPHRNAILGRVNTDQEKSFLAENPNQGWGQSAKQSSQQGDHHDISAS